MLRVIFCGTPDIAAPTLRTLNAIEGVEITHVVSQPDRPAGRGQKLKSPEVIETAKELQLNFFQTANLNKEEEFLTSLEKNPPDLIIVFAFAQFLNSRILQLPKIGCFNIHTSLLPRHRGAAPIHYSIWKGDKFGGVSIQRMVKKMDAGDICVSKPIAISERATTTELYEDLKKLSCESICDFIDLVQRDALIFTVQDESHVTFSPVIKKEDGYVDPLNQSAVEIDRRVRAFTPWPGVQVLFANKRVKLIDTIPGTQITAPAGTLKAVNKELILGCQNSSLVIKKLQFEGKPIVEASAWLNGIQADLPSVHCLLELK